MVEIAEKKEKEEERGADLKGIIFGEIFPGAIREQKRPEVPWCIFLW